MWEHNELQISSRPARYSRSLVPTKANGKYHLMNSFPRWLLSTHHLTDTLFGLHWAQEVFHKRFKQHFSGIAHVETDIDDFLIMGPDSTAHIKCLDRCESIELSLNVNRCQFTLKFTVLTMVPNPQLLSFQNFHENRDLS